MRNSAEASAAPEVDRSGGSEGAFGGSAPSERMFAIIDCIVGYRAPISVAEIGGTLGLPVPTVHRITKQLVGRGLLKRALGSKRLVPGPRLTELGVRAVTAAFVADLPHTILMALSEQINEHCQIGIMSEGKIFYLDAVSTPRPHGLQFSAGSFAPLHCSSIGKLHLARLSDTELRQMVQIMPLERFTETTICDPDQLIAEVDRVRRLGWATSNKEYSLGVVGCAVPILDRQGRMIAGLGASVPDAYVAFKDIARLIPTLQIAAEKIAQSIDGDT